MTIAAAIEIAAGVTPGPGLGKSPGVAHGAGSSGAAAQWFMASTASGADSFGAKWQTLLASLGSNVEGFNEPETDQETISARQVPKQIPDKSSISALTVGMSLRLGPGTEKENVETGAGTLLSPAGVRTGASVAQPAAGAATPASTRVGEKITAAEPGTESFLGSRPTRSINATKPNTVPSEALPGVIPAAVACPSQVVPAAVLTNPVTNSIDENAQFTQAEITADLSTNQPAAIASASSGTHPLDMGDPRETAGAANIVVQHITEEPDAPTQQRQASPVLSISRSSSSTISETVVSAAYNSAPLPVALLDESVAPLETSVPAVNLPTVIEPGQHILETQALAQTSATKLNPEQTVVSNQNPAPASVQSRNPMQMQVESESITPATVPSQSPRETQELSQNPSQTSTPDQYRTHTFVQNQEQLIPQPENQSVSGVASTVPGDSLSPTSIFATVTQSGQLHVALPIPDKPGSTSNEKALTSESLRSIHIAANFDSVQQGGRFVVEPPSGTTVDSFAMARSLSGVGEYVSTASEPERASSFASAQQDTRNTFATLDTAVAPRATTWIHAGTQRAEAGFQDPDLGWVSVRADLSGGGVHAQLVPNSADAAQALNSHLAGLNSYLVEHHTPVETLTLTAPEGGWSGLDSGRSAGEGMQQGSGQQTSQGADASIPSAPNPESVNPSPAHSLETPAFFGDMSGSVQAAIKGGFHISVMA